MVEMTPAEFIAAARNIFNAATGLLLLVGVLGIIVGAVNMQSGNPQKQEQGKETIKKAAIGTAIALIAFPLIAVIHALLQPLAGAS